MMRRREHPEADRPAIAAPPARLNTALTRWVNQGLAHGECPLCHAAHKAEKQYLWYFFDEYSTGGEELDRLRAAHGFCARHAGGLARIEVENLKSTLAISQTYEDTLTGLAEELRRLGEGGSLSDEPCPACVVRDEEVEHSVGYLLAMLERPATRERFASSPGLCVPHFRLVLEAAEDAAVRDLLVAVERHAAESLRDELSEHIRKQGAEARGEAPGPEADAWRRALWLTAGQPDPELGAG